MLICAIYAQGIYAQGIYAQGIYAQGIYAQGIWKIAIPTGKTNLIQTQKSLCVSRASFFAPARIASRLGRLIAAKPDMVCTHITVIIKKKPSKYI